MTTPGSSAVFVMPREVGAWPTAEALWITGREWARAAERRFGAAWIATPDGVWKPDDLPRRAALSPRRPHLRHIPETARTLAKDLRLWLRQRSFEVATESPWRAESVELVWEHHDLFNQAGRRLADAAGAPLVRYVHAPQVWEARKWGVRRPLWGAVVEAVEKRLLRQADLVACVSEDVSRRLQVMGVDPEKIVVAPMAVDPDRFSPEGETLRRGLGIDPSAVVIGWSGSFRPFHGLDRLLRSFGHVKRHCPEVHLLLVGDGPLRPALEAAASEAGLADSVIFVGAVPHAEMPVYVRTMDMTVVSSDGRGGFHYSPLKLREYAACGRPVVAPAEGELLTLSAEPFVSLHTAGDEAALASSLERLARAPDLRARMGAAARAYALERWTWDSQLHKVLEASGRSSRKGV